jgi:hypothetical protein
MNRLLSLSKSIPNFLLIQNKENKTIKKEETNKKNDSAKNSINLSSIYSKNDKRSSFEYNLVFSLSFPIKSNESKKVFFLINLLKIQ